jgi:hypothetical protein
VAGVLRTIKRKSDVLLTKLLGHRLRSVVLARSGLLSEFSAYDKLLEYIDANKIYGLQGDFLEIGAFMGGGSAKLARCAARHKKNCW